MTEARPEPLFHWFIPIDGDGARLGTTRAEQAPDFDYLTRVVQTAEEQDFHGLLIPDAVRERPFRRRRAADGNVDDGHGAGHG